MTYRIASSDFDPGPVSRIPFHWIHGPKIQAFYSHPAIWIPLLLISITTLFMGIPFAVTAPVSAIFTSLPMVLSVIYLIVFAYLMSQPANIIETRFGRAGTDTCSQLLIKEYHQLSKKRKKKMRAFAKQVNGDRDDKKLISEWQDMVKTYIQMDAVTSPDTQDKIQQIRNTFKEDQKVFEIMQENGWTDGTK